MGTNKLNTMMPKIAELTGINLDNSRKICNHSLRRTAIQRLKDLDVPEDERMVFSGHRSREGIRAYNSPNDEQRLRNTSMLISLDFDDIPYEEFGYFPGDAQNYVNFEADDDYDEGILFY